MVYCAFNIIHLNHCQNCTYIIICHFYLFSNYHYLTTFIIISKNFNSKRVLVEGSMHLLRPLTKLFGLSHNQKMIPEQWEAV